MKADDVKKLQQKKYRNEWRHFLVEGEHLILELHKAAFHSKKTQQHLQQARRVLSHP